MSEIGEGTQSSEAPTGATAPEVQAGSQEASRRETNPLGEALSEVARGKDNLVNAAAFTIEDAVNSLRYDEFGKEKDLTEEQVRDVHEAFFRASAARLSPEDRRKVFQDVNEGAEPRIFPPK